MSTDTPSLWLHVDGLSAATLGGQSLRNVLPVDDDAATRCLAQVAFRRDDVMQDVLERITWALLAWPDVQVLTLVDVADNSEVARIQRLAEPGGDVAGAPLRWRGYWLAKRPAVDEEARSANDDETLGFPPRTSRKHALFALDERSLARREQVWRRIQSLLGERIAVLAYRAVQRLVTTIRTANVRPCPVGAQTRAALRALPGAQPEDPGVALFVARLSPGGAEKSALDLATALVAHGVSVHLFTTFGSENTWAGRALAAGARVIDLPRFLPSACWLDYVAYFLQRRQIDVLHINNSHWLFAHVRELKAHLPHLRVISQLHAEGRPGMRDFLALAAEADDAIDCHSVISHFLRNRLLSRYAIEPHKIAVVRTGIDVTAEFDPGGYRGGDWRRQHGLSADTRLVAFIGRFSDLKRPLLFLAVARRVLERRPDVRFVLKGEGPLRSAIGQRLRSDPILAGAVTVEDATAPVQPLMIDADLMLLTSAMEGIAYVSYEALALGLVQVSADVGAQSELVTADCGVLVATGDGETDRFASAVIDLLDDPERCARLAAAGRARVQAWPSRDDVAEVYRALYRGAPLLPNGTVPASDGDGVAGRVASGGES